MRDAGQWQPAPKTLSLPENVVHIWRAELTSPSPEVLAQDERDKAAGFHFDKDRNRYIAARAILRQLIGRYENLAPAAVQFTYNTYGKPALEGSSLRFNASHSADLALFAFARQRGIGVDLEHIRPDFASREIASQFFCPDEIAALRALPAESQTAAFFACWTRKEAFIKAHGSGLSLPLHKFAVSVTGPAQLLRTDFNPAAAQHWTLHDLSVGTGFTAALALEGIPARIECWQWVTP
jgi:4'-phosphopantetheinyl transferase